jgi:hypothetical protein
MIGVKKGKWDVPRKVAPKFAHPARAINANPFSARDFSRRPAYS